MCKITHEVSITRPEGSDFVLGFSTGMKNQKQSLTPRLPSLTPRLPIIGVFRGANAPSVLGDRLPRCSLAYPTRTG